MLYCPNCGTKVKEDEYYCMKCGKSLPEDMNTRIDDVKPITKWWILPIVSIILVVFTVGLYAYILQYKTAKALEFYTEAEELILDENYIEANKVLGEAIKQNRHFSQAQISLDYTNEAKLIGEQLETAEKLLSDGDFNPSLELINNAEEKLTTYNGPAVDNLVERIDETYATAKLEQLKAQLEQGPSINELRILIWEAEEINHPEAQTMAASIRDRIVDYTFSKASEELNDKQFNNSLLIAEDGLKYAPESEKLQSLLTNINKEKVSFEAEAQERLEQAMDTAYKEHQLNENDAIDVLSVKVENDEVGQVVIKGEVKSLATVPINSILVEYVLKKNDEEILSNEIFVFPDTLYPTETGKFEFTHFDLNEKSTNLKAEVKKITWYTN